MFWLLNRFYWDMHFLWTPLHIPQWIIAQSSVLLIYLLWWLLPWFQFQATTTRLEYNFRGFHFFSHQEFEILICDWILNHLNAHESNCWKCIFVMCNLLCGFKILIALITSFLRTLNSDCLLAHFFTQK